MDHVELLKKVSAEADELIALAKSYEEKMKSAPPEAPGSEGPSSDAAGDAVHAADHGEENLESYATKLSDEELYGLLAALTDEAEGRGVGQDVPPEQGEAPAVEGDEPVQAAPAEGSAPPVEGGEAPPAEGSEGGESAPPMEGQEAGGEEAGGSIEAKVSGLSDEELEALMSALQAEQSARSAAPAAGPEGADKSMMPDSAAMAMQKAMEEQSEKASKEAKEMMKSIKALSDQVAALKGDLTVLKKSAPVAAPKDEVPVRTYAGPNSVQVLEKSSGTSEGAVLFGNDLANWLLGEQRKGNQKVKSELVGRASLVKSVESASSFYSELKALGLVPPAK
jgi:hypothetical protein